MVIPTATTLPGGVTLHDRIIGGVVGLVVGDALGVPAEFRSRDELDAQPITCMTGYGSHQQPPGTWSDDSSLALATLESLLAGYDPRDMMGRFHRWLFQQHMTPHGLVFDVGITTRESIAMFDQGKPAAEWGGRLVHHNGNGSLMRILPLSLSVHRLDTPTILQRSSEVSSLTHAHPRSCLCCGYFSLLIRSLLAGDTLPEAMATASRGIGPFVPAEERPQLERVLSGQIICADRCAISGSGYVVHCLEASLWCAAHADSYETAVLLAVNLGEDTDTTAAVTGAIAGVLYGRAGVPDRWIEQLARRDDVLKMAAALADRLATP